MIIGNRNFDFEKHTYVMGILNVTPDSFFDGGRWIKEDTYLRRVEEMISDGADIIDVGGESTRPGYEEIGDDEEIQRVIPVIEKIKSEFDITVSLDTYKPIVAQSGISAGADMINDIWGLKRYEDMAKVIAKAKVPACLMHNRNDRSYADFIQDLCGDLSDSIKIAEENGIDFDKIILDPGIGFAKNREQNLMAINALDELKVLGCPVLLGCSRKSVIGDTLKLPVEERLEGTLATTAVAVMKGAAIVRVHDIRENVRVVKMTEAIRNS